MALPLEECGWRQVGCKLEDAKKGSDMEVYYSLLCATVRRCQADMKRIKPNEDEPPPEPVLSNPDDEPPQQSPTVVVIEKIADMTHKGSGL